MERKQTKASVLEHVSVESAACSLMKQIDAKTCLTPKDANLGEVLGSETVRCAGGDASQ
jgi:hypothetical protein